MSASESFGGSVSPCEFLTGWFAGLYRFDGLILVLQGYFDETGGHDTAALTAVAGFVFDKPALERFTADWSPRVEGLAKPYRSALCNAGRPPFSRPDHRLMDDLATISTEAALAGFVVAVRDSDFREAMDNGVRKLVDSPYTVCVIALLSAMGHWVKESARKEQVHCWFESGGYHEREAQDFVRRIGDSQGAKEQFGPMGGQSWIPKESAPAFCSVDLLAWEWQRNVLRSEDQWTPRMAMMMANMRDASKPIYASHLTAATITHWAMFNGFYELHRD